MNVTEINLLNRKSETKKDGIYTYHGNFYAVINKRFVAYVTPYGECLQRMGNFNVVIGQLTQSYSWQRKEALVKWLKAQPRNNQVWL